MEDFKHRRQIEVRFRDCDMMGHVNNAVYLTYFEEARVSFFSALSEGPLKGFDFILAEVTCTYHHPAKMGETLSVGLRVSRIGNSSFDFEYGVFGPGGEKIATGKSVQVMYDYARARSIPVPPELRARMLELGGAGDPAR